MTTSDAGAGAEGRDPEKRRAQDGSPLETQHERNETTSPSPTDPHSGDLPRDPEKAPDGAGAGDADSDPARAFSADPEAGQVCRAQRAASASSRSHASHVSAASSVRSRPMSVVPSSKRRGFLGRFTLIPELEQPYEYANTTKWCITAIVALAGVVGPMGSAIFYPALDQMASDFNTRPVIVNMTVALYMLALGIFPLWWSSFSETLGRRNIYLSSFALFVVFAILSAVSTNIAMLIVMRLLTGGSGASVQAVGAGTIADIWAPAERGRAMSIFYIGPLIGPMLGPILGGGLSQVFGWQATMWALVIYGGIVFAGLAVLLPETLARDKQRSAAAAMHGVPSSSSQDAPAADSAAAAGNGDALVRTGTTQSVKQGTKSASALVKRFLVDPLSVLLYLRFPPVLITVYYAAITFGTLFVLNISVQSAFYLPPYEFSQTIVGLLYIPSGLGYVITSVLGGKWLDRIMIRQAEKRGRYDSDGNLILLPEDRLRENAWVAGTLYPVSLLLYGWTVERGTFWFVPLMGTFLFGLSSMMVFAAATTMLTEFMPKRTSSGVAVNNFIRNTFSCIGTVAAQPVITAIGHGWLFTILGLFTWVTGYACIWVLRKRAPIWRVAMDKALNG